MCFLKSMKISFPLKKSELSVNLHIFMHNQTNLAGKANFLHVASPFVKTKNKDVSGRKYLTSWKLWNKLEHGLKLNNIAFMIT